MGLSTWEIVIEARCKFRAQWLFCTNSQMGGEHYSALSMSFREGKAQQYKATLHTKRWGKGDIVLSCL